MPWAELHFIRPWWLVGLLPALWLLVLLWRASSAQAGWNGLIAPQLLQHLLLGRNEGLGRAPLALLGCAWLVALIALAGPTWERQPQSVYSASLDQVVVLDMSPSMALTDVAPDRLTRARFAITDLMAQSLEGRTALIVFGAEHHVVVPLTDDNATVEQLLRALSVDVLPAEGDSAAAALRASVQLLAAAKSRAAHVILISDGIGDPADSINAARQLRDAGAKLSVIGVGIGVGTGPEAQLRELARSGAGVYQSLGSRGAHPALTMQAVAEFSQQPQRETNVDRWVEKGVWLLLPLLLLAALGYRRGWLSVVVVMALCPAPQQAMAVSWDDLWSRPDQRAKRLLDAGQTSEAAQLFTDPNWRATARYRSGEFDQAAAQFSDSGSAYNRANALAKAGKLGEALKSYEQALTARPDDDDARFNRDLVKKILDQQQQQKQQGQQGQQENSEQKSQHGESSDADSEQSSSAQQQAQKDKGQDGAQSPSTAEASKSDKDQDPGAAQAQDKDESSAADKAQAKQREAVQQQAKSDVQPQKASSAPEQADGSGDAVPGNEQDKPVAAADQLAERPPTEQELALQQWLRQVPDDPGGLLRRKFMLEHLQRRKGRNEQ